MNNKLFSLLLIFFSCYLLQACTYDKAEEIKKQLPQNISYSKTIKRIVSTYCNNQSGCHGLSPGSQDFQDYDGLINYANLISGSINHRKDARLNMPQFEPKLSQANIDSFDSWLNAGFPNN